MTIKTILATTVLSLTLIGTAYADDHGRTADGDDMACGNTTGQWMSKDTARARAAEQGYDVRRIKREDGCYELYALNKQGQRLELYMNPVSGNIIKSKPKS